MIPGMLLGRIIWNKSCRLDHMVGSLFGIAVRMVFEVDEEEEEEDDDEITAPSPLEYRMLLLMSFK